MHPFDGHIIDEDDHSRDALPSLQRCEIHRRPPRKREEGEGGGREGEGREVPVDRDHLVDIRMYVRMPFEYNK